MMTANRVECPYGCGGVAGHLDSPSCDRPAPESSVPGAVGEPRIERPVYLHWSEDRSRKPVEVGWGGDDLYRCNECPEWTGSGIEQGERHSLLHQAGGAVGEREEPLDVERLREAHRLAQVMDGDYMVNVATLYARLSVNEGGSAPVARTEAEPHE